MSCNPSIGGVGKGHLVREIDVFDGLMARAADKSSIHRRMLNRSKGPAVWGPRVQAYSARFTASLCLSCSATAAVEIIPVEALRIEIANGRVCGVETSDRSLDARAVEVATGTFLDGRLFVGNEVADGGRVGERASSALAGQMREVGLGQGRLKTGTPPRIDGRTIDWARLEEQPGDVDEWTMSAMAGADRPRQIRCAIARTNARTHSVIQEL